MVQIMSYEDDFFKTIEEGRKLVLYGIGMSAQSAIPYLPRISYVCDQKATDSSFFQEWKVMKPEELERIQEKLVIIICVKKKETCLNIKNTLKGMNIDAKVFEYYNSISFNTYHPIERKKNDSAELKRVRLVCYEDGWILNKFARRLKEELEKRNIYAEIGKCIDKTADINHHIAYHMFEPIQDYNDTVMITHVDSINKIEQIKRQLEVAKMGICMSKETMKQLILNGVRRDKLCYINPAHDGVIKPRKYILGITHRNHESIDHRKRINALLDICDKISPDFFEFKIMGDGWENIVNEMRKRGFSVKYYDQFDYDIYIELVPTLDYYLFWGFDEGSMGYLDALAAGVKTIVTPQGFHLDTRYGLTYPCRTIPDFIDTLLELEREKKQIVESVVQWTWGKYTEKHIEVWKYILGQEEGIYQNKHNYEDGIFSVLGTDA